ncbi:hypothetical protein [Actinoplanes sp. NBRC 103695]|uniref:hypothetical protein n=1 Tax=Actinoplanes sp. NBRC 103695 TaxID=3032202 RepID=UPI0024A1E7D5|nr:hypothetical protein [Actinoplanes sp. NBRC 103695]GLY97981.1 hypothetical protein Acsp02_52350 [Actinoplanes sp. NBRC 103695]
MRTRIGSSLAVLAVAVGLTAGVAGPIYSAAGKPPAKSPSVAGRIMVIVPPPAPVR